MITIDIKIPERQKNNALNLVDPKGMAWAEAQALNRAAANTRDFGLKLVARQMGIPRTKLAKRGRRTDWRGSARHGAFSQTKRANRRVATAVLQGFGRPFNINRWKNKPIYEGSRTSIKTRRQTRTRRAQRVIGVTHTAWGDTTTIGNVWRLSNNAYMVRSGKSFRSVYGPGVTHVLQYPRVSKSVIRFAQRRFNHHFRAAVDYVRTSPSHVR